MPQLLAISEDLQRALQLSRLLSAEQVAALAESSAPGDASSDASALRQLVLQGWLTLYQAERLFEGRARGFFFDDFKVIDLLGLGGMGWVYRAVHNVTGETVALKVLRDELQNDQGMLARFEHEARVGLKLDHPHIARTRSFGLAGGLPYTILDLVDGPNLMELQKEHRIPAEQACEFVRQAALGVEHAHRKQVIHRDVKPQNLLVDQTGRVRLVDFGLSMAQAGDAGDEFSFAMIFGHDSVGTMDFAAPEQLENSLQADARSDVYSLGGTLFALLTRLNPGEVRPLSQQHVPFRSVRHYVPSIPEGIAEIVARMLDNDPSRRFATAADCAAALSKWAQPGPVEFDFQAVLKERKRKARERMATLSQSRSGSSRSSRSTARPGAAPSVVTPAVHKKSESPDENLPPSLDAAAEQSHRAAGISGPAVRKEIARTPGTFLLRFPQVDCRVALEGQRLLVGRSAECDLQFTDPAVSSRHCEFQFDGSRWWLSDLDSRNGTSVNGSPIKKHVLHPGDEIQFGNRQRCRLERIGDHRSRSVSGWQRIGLIGAAMAAVAIASWAILNGWLGL